MRSGREKTVAHGVMNEIRAPCTGSGPGPRSALRADSVVLLGAGAHGQLALRPSGTLRSDRGRESEVEARGRAPPRRLRCAPRPSMGPEPVQGTRISFMTSCATLFPRPLRMDDTPHENAKN